MESTKSFGRYSRADEAAEQAYRRKTRKRIIILVASSVVLLVVIAGTVAALVARKDSNTPAPTGQASAASAIRAICKVTQYPEYCYSSISSLSKGPDTQPQTLFKLSLKAALRELNNLSSSSFLVRDGVDASNPRVKAALAECRTLIQDAADYFNQTISSTSDDEILSKIDEMKTWISSAITYQETCLDGLREINFTSLDRVLSTMNTSAAFTSNSLAIVAKILGAVNEFKLNGRRLGSGSPNWVGSRSTHRRLLNRTPKPDLVVAKDGTGNFTTITNAIKVIPKKSKSRFVIYIKTGRYNEQVILDKNKWNVMIYGDGMDKSVVVGDKNFVDGTSTYSTATFAVMGKGFIAKDIGFMNTAGAAKHQAVAFRSGGDQSVMYRCSFIAFQDTLYAHSNRQFYRDCLIVGTIDFIFGNAAAVFQNCVIQPRQPLANQFNTITAQGKKDVNQNTGFSIQKCTLTPFDNITAPTYLGRPWKQYSTTVITGSSIGAFLQPSGWIEWIRNVDPPNTIFYAENKNTGPGSGVTNRVKWAGYRSSLTDDQVTKFAIPSFIQGAEWLPQTEVTFEDFQ